jgi:hypothetical protein
MSAKVMALLFSAAGQQTFVPDSDVTCTAIATNSPTTLVTTDPSLTLANLSAPAGNRVIWDIIHHSQSSNDPTRPAVLLLGGSKIYVTVSAAGTVFFWLDDVVS